MVRIIMIYDATTAPTVTAKIIHRETAHSSYTGNGDSLTAIRAALHTRHRLFACREGEQSLAAVTATPDILLILHSLRGHRRLVCLSG